MRVVLDTNIWISALVYSRESSALHQILDRFLAGEFELVTSRELRDEFAEICIRHSVAKSVIEKYLTLMQHTRTQTPPYVHLVVPEQIVDVITADPDDDRVLECAIAGKANVIVSGDKHLLKLAHYQNVVILSPHDFITSLSQGN